MVKVYPLEWGCQTRTKERAMTESAPDDVAAQRARVMEGMRGYGATFTELSRRFAEWLSLHHTDAVALLEIAEAEQRGDPLSPARLGERVSLTSGATTALINRLEHADHVVRTREHSDRRVVTLHTTEHVGALAERYFGPLGDRLDAMMANYPPEQLRQFETFVAHLRDTMEEHLREQNSNR
jgi:MarR family transcriptional regulator, organic hydroperoxide resistance regulator